MSSTIATYLGTGSQTDFTFEFDYLRKEFVKVLVDGSEVPFSFHTTQTVQITPAPAEGKVIIIKRATDRDRLVDFVDGSVLIAGDLNVSALQAIHIAAEALDAASGGLLIDQTGAYSAGFRRLANLGDPVQGRDAVTKEWAETNQSATLGQTITARDAAQAARDAAQASQTASSNNAATATTKAAEASSSATTATNKAAEAAGSASAANASATAADGFADEAYAYSVTASAKAGEALTSRNQAETYAAQVAGNIIPVGAIAYFAANVAPNGWLTCNGVAVSPVYPELRDYLLNAGSPYGMSGSDPRLPDLRGEFIRGWDASRGVDPGRSFGSWQNHDVADHTHPFMHVANGNSHPVSNEFNSAKYINTTQDGTVRPESETGPVVGPGHTETRPRNIAMLPCIKAFGTVDIVGMAQLSELLAAIATYEEAIAGMSTNKLMTPNRVEQHMVANAFGWGQTWQDVKASRAGGTNYQNTTGRPITVIVRGRSTTTTGRPVEVSSNGTTWIAINELPGSGAAADLPVQFIVPEGQYYRVNGAITSTHWVELR